VKSLDAHRARSLLGARAQLVSMTTRLSNMIRGVLKTFGLLPGAGRGLRFDRNVEALLDGAPEIALVVRPLVYVSTVEDPNRFSRSRAVGAYLGLTPRRYQSGETDRSGHISRYGDGLARTLMYEAAIVIIHRVKRSLHLKDGAAVIEQRSGPGKAQVALARKLSVILHSVWRSGEPSRWAPQRNYVAVSPKRLEHPA
jgi:transposase